MILSLEQICSCVIVRIHKKDCSKTSNLSVKGKLVEFHKLKELSVGSPSLDNPSPVRVVVLHENCGGVFQISDAV